MKKIFTYLSLFIFGSAFTAFAAERTFNINLHNTLDTERIDYPIAIDLNVLAPGMTVTKATVVDGDTEIASQLDDFDKDNMPDELAFVVNVGAGKTKTISLTLSDEGTQADYEPRVWSAFLLRGPKKDQIVDIEEVCVPGHVNFYNMVYGHGPMFESELVGYRVYFNQKQTLDPYGKFQKRLELNDTKFYPTDQHIADGYGDDVLMAGNSCGVGAFKGWNGIHATHIEPVNSRTERILATGPVRVIVEVDVDDWDYQGDKLDMTNRYTLYAGHRDLMIDAKFRKPLDDKTFATGVERIMGDETVSWSDHDGLIASWGRYFPVTDTVKFAKETIGIATYVPKKYIVEETEDPDNFLYVVSSPGADCITYYTMFTSRKETFGFEDKESWFAYLPEWKENIDNPLEISIIEK